MVSTAELVRQSKEYRIRKFLDSLSSEVPRVTAITIFREVLATYEGLTGKWVQEVWRVFDSLFSYPQALWNDGAKKNGAREGDRRGERSRVSLARPFPMRIWKQ